MLRFSKNVSGVLKTIKPTLTSQFIHTELAKTLTTSTVNRSYEMFETVVISLKDRKYVRCTQTGSGILDRTKIVSRQEIITTRAQVFDRLSIRSYCTKNGVKKDVVDSSNDTNNTITALEVKIKVLEKDKTELFERCGKLEKELGVKESQLDQYRRCLGVYKFRPRIDVAEVKYLKGSNLSDGELRKILTIDESKVNAVSARIIETYNSASRDHQEITLNLEDIETKIELGEADIRSSSLQKATRHYLRWKYIFRFSSYKEIKGLREVLSEEQIDELCSDISILWTLASPVHHIALPGLTLKKEDVLFGFEVLEFKSEYSTEILELLY